MDEMNEQEVNPEAPDPGTPPDLAPPPRTLGYIDRGPVEDPPRDEAEREVDRAWDEHEADPDDIEQEIRNERAISDHDDIDDPRPYPHHREYMFGDD